MGILDLKHFFGEIRHGTMFQALEDFYATGLIHWNAPETTEFRCTVPKGTVFIISGDFSSLAWVIRCIPRNREEFEKAHVPKSDRDAEKYAGYSFLFTRPTIKKKLKAV